MIFPPLPHGRLKGLSNTPGQGGAPVAGYQASVWSYQGVPQWIEEEHGSALHTVYAFESVVGEEAILCEPLYECVQILPDGRNRPAKRSDFEARSVYFIKIHVDFLASEINHVKLVISETSPPMNTLIAEHRF